MKYIAEHIDDILFAVLIMFGMSCCTAIAVVEELNKPETQEQPE